jgi:hypothetical protein
MKALEHWHDRYPTKTRQTKLFTGIFIPAASLGKSLVFWNLINVTIGSDLHG